MSAPPPYTEQPSASPPPFPPAQPPSYPTTEYPPYPVPGTVPYPPGPGYPPAPPYPGTPINNVPASYETVSLDLGPFPQACICPHCNASVTSEIIYESGTLTWISCALIFVCGGPIFCCLIPFCCPPCQDVRHICPNCHLTMGVFRRL
ncbi:hypothetical protein SprV_0301199400 [Sparganum proliferum]